MDRAEWLKKMRVQAEAIYDHLAPGYWEKYGLYDNTTHCQFIAKFLERLKPGSTLLDAGCGAGRYDGMLLEAGHEVLGVDQADRMLARAREHFPPESYPKLRYAKLGLQEIDFKAQFDGAICIDALEHVCPEDWPGIVARLQAALKPGGVLYVTVEVPEWDEVKEAYERARAKGLPVVFGEVVDGVDETYAQIVSQEASAFSDWQTDAAVYHYHPTLEQVRAWFEQAGLVIEEEAMGVVWYAHLLARKKA